MKTFSYLFLFLFPSCRRCSTAIFVVVDYALFGAITGEAYSRWSYDLSSTILINNRNKHSDIIWLHRTRRRCWFFTTIVEGSSCIDNVSLRHNYIENSISDYSRRCKKYRTRESRNFELGEIVKLHYRLDRLLDDRVTLIVVKRDRTV